MHFLVLGNGYLGLEFARQAAGKNYTLTTVNRTGQQATYAADLTSASDLCQLRDSLPPIDLILHAASSSRGGPEAYQSVFVEGTQLILETFPGTHLLFTSSTSVYHQTDGSEVDETSATEPTTATSQLLLQAEKNVLQAGGTVARLSGIYGPGRSAILKKFLQGTATLSSPLSDGSSRLLNQIHRDDAASALLLLAEKQPGGLFNLTDDTPTTQLATYQGLAKILNKPLPPNNSLNASPHQEKKRKRALTHKKVLNQKLRSLGWSPQHPSFLHAVPSLTSTEK